MWCRTSLLRVQFRPLCKCDVFRKKCEKVAFKRALNKIFRSARIPISNKCPDQQAYASVIRATHGSPSKIRQQLKQASHSSDESYSSLNLTQEEMESLLDSAEKVPKYEDSKPAAVDHYQEDSKPRASGKKLPSHASATNCLPILPATTTTATAAAIFHLHSTRRCR